MYLVHDLNKIDAQKWSLLLSLYVVSYYIEDWFCWGLALIEEMNTKPRSSSHSRYYSEDII